MTSRQVVRISMQQKALLFPAHARLMPIIPWQVEAAINALDAEEMGLKSAGLVRSQLLVKLLGGHIPPLRSSIICDLQ